jgi:hypothetical protein
VLVPTTGTLNEISGHHNIAFEFCGDQRFSAKFGRFGGLLEELNASPASCAVISAEDLEFLVNNEASLRFFHTTLTSIGWAPAYVVFFRRPDEYAVSLYATLRARKMIQRGFFRYLLRILFHGSFKTGREFYDFNRCRFRRRWSAAIGGAPLIEVDFDATLKKAGPVAALTEIMGIADPAILTEAQTSPALNRAVKWRIGRLLAAKVLLLRPPSQRRIASAPHDCGESFGLEGLNQAVAIPRIGKAADGQRVE